MAVKYFYEIIVSTDDEKIIKISRDAGVNVPFKRPKKMLLSPSIDVVKHALYFMEKNDVISGLGINRFSLLRH